MPHIDTKRQADIILALLAFLSGSLAGQAIGATWWMLGIAAVLWRVTITRRAGT